MRGRRPAGALLALFVLSACGQDMGMGPQPVPEGGNKEKGRGPATTVLAGIDQIELENGGTLRGRRVGLVLHGASTTVDGRPTVDALRAKGVDVVRLFAPEHGVKGAAAAGEKIAGGKDEGTKLPVVSLYGEKNKPSAEDLKGLDALVVDLQDAGVRFYTYSSTMLHCLDAAAEHGVEIVVLDRPNPLGGERVEGPVSAPRDQVPASLVNMAPGPLVHGLTLGEMARYANARKDKPARLTVVPLRGWKRTMVWAETGRQWIPPSPNLRTPEAAIAYPGTALVEATNISEGRGTEAPFLLVGAPWLKPELVVAAVKVPGFTLEPTTFTPSRSPAAPEPKHLDKASPGVRIKVADAHAAQPYLFGVALLHALRQQPGFQWRSEGALDRLAGTRRLREELEKGTAPEAIAALDQADIKAWKDGRLKSLLY